MTLCQDKFEGRIIADLERSNGGTSLYLVCNFVRLRSMDKNGEKLPITFKILQILNALTAAISSILLLISLSSYTFSGVLFPTIGRSLIEESLVLVVSLGMLKRRRWAWIASMFGSVLGSLAILVEFIIRTADYSPLWLVASVGIAIFIYFHRHYYNR